jgi:hypothetical protein
LLDITRLGRNLDDMSKLKHLLTTKQTANLLRCDISTVLRETRAGRLPFADKAPGGTGAYYFDPGVIREIAAKRLETQRAALADAEARINGIAS